MKVPIVHGILVLLVRAKYILLSNIRVNEVLLGLKKQPKLIFIIIKKNTKYCSEVPVVLIIIKVEVSF